jgi:acetone carboxylase gamma subunit
MTLVEQLLFDYITEAKARIAASNEKIEKLREVILEEYATIKEAQTALQNTCEHKYKPVFTDDYTPGSYLDVSTNVRTFMCPNCAKVLSTEHTSGGYS